MFQSSTRGSAVVFSVMLGIITSPSWSPAAQIFVGGDPAKVGIVDQHTTDRGEALYDTRPAATGWYNRVVDADTVVPARRYDALPEYYNATDARTLNLSLINGAWLCSPTLSWRAPSISQLSTRTASPFTPNNRGFLFLV